MTVLNLNNADKLYYGATEVQKLYKGSDLLYPKSFNLLDLQPALWLDANDSSTITLVSGAVSEWRDKSGNNRHATQSNASNRPIYSVGKINGTNVVTYNGTSHFMTFPNLTLNDFTVCYMTTFSSNNPITHPQIGVNSPSVFVPMLGMGANSFGYRSITESTYSIDYPSSRAGQFTFGIMSRAGVTLSGYLEGSFVNSITSDSISINSVGQLGGRQFWYSPTYFLGDFSQIIIFPRVLTQAERQQMEGYLAHKTGLQGNLPVNHPFKNIAP